MSNIYYDHLYYRLGIRTNSHILNPRIIKTESFKFPKNSVLHLFNINPVKSFVNDKPILQNTDLCYINTIGEYTREHIGRYTLIASNNLVKYIQEANKINTNYKYLLPNKEGVVTEKTLRVINYEFLRTKYRYQAQPFLRVYELKNSLYTLIDNIDMYKDRHIFINFEIPNILPDRLLLEKYKVNLTNNKLVNLPTYKDLLILEFWKLLDPNHREESILNDKKLIDNMNNITLLLTCENKTIMIKLPILISLVEEYKLSYGINSYNYKKAMKIFYILLHKTINAEIKPITVNEDEINNTNINNIASGVNLEKDDNDDNVDIDVDEYLEEHVKSNGKELTEDDDTSIEMDNIEEDSVTKYEIDKVLDDASSDVDVPTIEELKEEQFDFTKNIEAYSKSMLEGKVIGKKSYTTIEEKIKNQSKEKAPYEELGKLGDVLDYEKDNLNVDENIADITDNNVIFDKRTNKKTLDAINKGYLKKLYKKDIVRSVYGIQNSPSIVESYNIDKKENILGGIEDHTVVIRSLKGRSTTVRFTLPIIKEDGTYNYRGNNYLLRSQCVDLPIKKIKPGRVALTSYYGKLFITKDSYKVYDPGYTIMGYLSNKYQTDPDYKEVILVSPNNKDMVFPKDYGIFSRYVKLVRYKNTIVTFDYNNRTKIFKNISETDILDIEQAGKYIIVGNDNGYPLIMDMNNKVYKYKSKSEIVDVGSIYSVLNMTDITLPIECAFIKLNGKNIPIFILMCYYYGLKNLLKLLNVKYSIENRNARIDNVNNDKIVVLFKDCKLVIERDYDKRDMILGGMNSIKNVLKDTNMDVLNHKSSFNIIYSKLEYSTLNQIEIKLLDDLFVDPITAGILKDMKEPTNFRGLIIRSCELLVDDNYINPKDATSTYIRSYERLAGMVYETMCKAIKKHENASYYGKSSLAVNPNEIMNKLIEDSGNIIVDDNNPMAFVKLQEDLTFLGFQGRSKDTMSIDMRRRHSSEIGIRSEANKDNGDVGISTSMPANPNIINLRGKVGNLDIDKAAWSDIVSSSAMLMPFTLGDDSKRMSFTSIMLSHVVGMKTMKVPYVRTGYESIVGIKCPPKFCVSAEEEGKVLESNDKEVTVEYKTLGKKTYKLYSWNSKIESGKCYTHHIVSNLKKGDKFIKDDTITYNSTFFEPDLFNKRRVVYKQGDIINVSLAEDIGTYEDSGIITKGVLKRLGKNFDKVFSMVIKNTDNIVELVKIGQEVKGNTPLFVLLNETTNIDGLDEKAIKILQDLKTGVPKAKVNGIVEKIELYYNCELESCSKTLQNIIKESDKHLKHSKGFTGRVDNSYSIKGKQLLENEIEIKIFINVSEDLGIGDKCIFANQMKFTVGQIYDEIHGEDGTNVDAMFSCIGFENRIVTSPNLIGTTSTVLDVLGKKAVELYFGK
ncbi:hypothetical protein ACVWU4_001025 [Campylobacter coli]